MEANISRTNQSQILNGEYEEEDYFGYVFEDSTSFKLKVIAWALTQFVGNPLMLGLIAFKRHGGLNYQTLVDKLIVYYYSACLAYNLTGTNCDFVRTFFKLPRRVCILYTVQISTLCIALCLTAVEVNLLRYLYICIWKNVGKLNDDFFGHFFAVLNSVIILFETLLVVLTEEYVNFELAFCEGSDPAKIIKNGAIPWGQFFTMSIIGICCLTCLALNLMIFLYTKRKHMQMGFDVSKEVPGQIKANLFDMEKFYECVVILSIIVAIAPSVYVRWSFESGTLSTVSPLLLMASPTLPNVTLFLLWPLSMYARNPVMRHHTWRNLKETQFGYLVCQLMSRARDRVSPQQLPSA